MKIPDILWKPDFWVEYQPGRNIFAEGEPGDALFILMEGQVEVSIRGQLVGTFEPVDIFGEMALLDGKPRSATVKAKSKCKLARVDEKRFRFLVQHQPQFALDVMRSMAERLRWREPGLPGDEAQNGSSQHLQAELQALKNSLETLTNQLGQMLQKLPETKNSE